MIWVMYGGIIAGVVLTIAAAIVVVPPILRVRAQAQAIVPNALIAKFVKAQDDLDRVQGATVLIEELIARTRDAIERMSAALQTLRNLLPNR